MLDWKRFEAIANKFQYKARPDDREDLKHDILVALAQAEKERSKGNRHRELTESMVFKIAKYECQKYWRRIGRYNVRTVSLDKDISHGNGYHTNLAETLPDKNVTDMDDLLDAKTEISHYPRRILKVAHKILRGEVLLNKEYQLLYRFRHKRGVSRSNLRDSAQARRKVSPSERRPKLLETGEA